MLSNNMCMFAWTFCFEKLVLGMPGRSYIETDFYPRFPDCLHSIIAPYLCTLNAFTITISLNVSHDPGVLLAGAPLSVPLAEKKISNWMGIEIGIRVVWLVCG